MARPRGFFSTLFDFSFSEFIALKIIGVLYAIGIFLIGLATLAIVISGFAKGFSSGLVALIVGPLIFLLYVILIRIGLEGLIAALRTADNTSRIAENTRDLRNI
jgi:Domain of unknown function (DUF4282)